MIVILSKDLAMQETKRSIRLKEYPPGTSVEYTPGEAYVDERNGALVNKPYLVETDAQGFIKGSGSPDQAEYSVVVLGDSVVESLFLDPNERFCAQLEVILRNEYGIDVIVRNGGYSGATTLHAFNTFLNKVVPMKPSVVILMSGIVDIGVASLRSGYWIRIAGSRHSSSPVRTMNGVIRIGSPGHPLLIGVDCSICSRRRHGYLESNYGLQPCRTSSVLILICPICVHVWI